jgi:lipopolysaccharide export LptBFGC system permease protein LptF
MNHKGFKWAYVLVIIMVAASFFYQLLFKSNMDYFLLITIIVGNTAFLLGEKSSKNELIDKEEIRDDI